MIRTKLLGLLAALYMVLSALPARAAEQPAQPYVVVVGIDQYADKQILPRKHAEADAKALYDLFVSKDHLGVAADHIRLLLGKADKKRPSESASRENVMKALKWLETKPARDDLVVLVFIGQGAPLGDRLCFFAADSTYKGRTKNAIAGGDIEHALDKLKSQRCVAFIDVNFLGFNSGKEPAPDPNITDLFRIFLGKEDAKGVIPSRVAFFAGNGVKPSLDLKKHGIFTKVLLDGLGGKADTQGYEPDGVVTVGELAKYVRKELADLARAHGTTDAEKDQTPAILEGQNNDFVITLNPAAFPKAHDRLVKFDKLAQDQNLPREVAEEGHNLLSRMPKLEAQQELRKAYQKLVDGKATLAEFQTERKDILAGTRISQNDAGNYALMVLRAAKVVRQGYVKDVNQGQLVDYAIRGLYRHLNEKLPSSIKERLENAKTMKDADLLKLLTDARTHLGKREDLASGKDITYSLHPMLGKLDKHTDYIDPETLTRLRQDIEGQFTGIGVQIRKNNIRDQLQVVTPIRGTPAYKAGLYAGDIITTIIREVDSEGNPLAVPEVLPTKGMSTDVAVKKIIGKAGTKVKLVVEREGSEKPLEFTLIRGQVEVETVLGTKRKKDDTWSYVIDPENKICYVRLTQFSHNTYRDLEKVMRQLSKEGIKGFILDLRFNPGGLLDQAVKISDLFIDDGLIVTIRPRKGPETSYIGKSDGSYTEFPMVCLVNGFSASASEIVSACLQDHDRAMIMGSRSYGKGSVQTIHPFDTGGRLKLTTATFWRPNGKNLNRASTQGRDEDEWGVTPNAGFNLKLPTKELNELQDHLRDSEIIKRPDQRGKPAAAKSDFRDRQLDMALEYLRAQIRTAAQGNGKKTGG
jgi:C-terminal peptidase prc